MKRISWDGYAIGLAYTAASRSEDPYHQVGAALLRYDHSVAATGYNGAPSGVEIDWSDRDARRAQVIHAESNALRYVLPGEVELLASTMMPCQGCILLASAYRIPRIVYSQELDPGIYDREAILALANACHITVKKEIR